MAKSLSFKEDRKVYEAQLEKAQAELEALEAELNAYDVQTQDCRETIKMFRDFMAGKDVSLGRAHGSSKIKALEVNPETNRPGRGQRRTQIERICKKLGRGKSTFRTVDVLNELRQVESDLSSGMKSYTYAVLNTLEKEKFVKKVGRGTWQLK